MKAVERIKGAFYAGIVIIFGILSLGQVEKNIPMIEEEKRRNRELMAFGVALFTAIMILLLVRWGVIG